LAKEQSIYLVSCVGKKRGSTVAAKDLITGVEVCHENNHNGAPRSPPRRPCAGCAFAGFRDAADGATDPPGDMINYCASTPD